MGVPHKSIFLIVFWWLLKAFDVFLMVFEIVFGYLRIFWCFSLKSIENPSKLIDIHQNHWKSIKNHRTSSKLIKIHQTNLKLKIHPIRLKIHQKTLKTIKKHWKTWIHDPYTNNQKHINWKSWQNVQKTVREWDREVTGIPTEFRLKCVINESNRMTVF